MAAPTATTPPRLNPGSFTQPNSFTRRQLAVIIGPEPTATVSFLSSALVAAQASAAVVQQQLQQQVLSVQQLQSASISAVASLQSVIAIVTNSANLAMASASNSAAIAIADLSNSLANAEIKASSAATAAMDEADNRVSVVRETTFSIAQITVAIVVSIVGTMLFTSLGFLVFLYRRQREKRALELNASIKRPDTSASVRSTNFVWDNRFQRRGPDAKPPKLGELHVCKTESPDLIDSMTDALNFGKNEQRRPDWPLGLDSPHHQPHARTTSERETVEGFSLFPKTVETIPDGNVLITGESKVNLDKVTDESNWSQ